MTGDYRKLINFLTQTQRSSRCPWCNCDSWELISNLDSTKLEIHEIIETSYPTKEKSINFLETNSTDSNVSLRLRCKNCGCELRFDYLYILDKMKREAQSQ